MPKTPLIYQLRVSLVDSEPEIWRQLLVPSDTKLPKLHLILQIAMGWRNCHLHAFRDIENSYGPMPEEGWIEDEKNIKLSAVLQETGQILEYEYDMGDSWLHAIELEKVLSAQAGTLYPSCIDGKNDCPPEDCGGIPGYENLQEAVANPKHPEHHDLKCWLDDYEPESFVLDRINPRLEALMPKTRKKGAAKAGTTKKKPVRRGMWVLDPSKAKKKAG